MFLLQRLWLPQLLLLLRRGQRAACAGKHVRCRRRPSLPRPATIISRSRAALILPVVPL